MNLQQMKKFFPSFILLLLLSVGAFAQTRDVTGKITDKESGEPLPGVSIRVMGSGQSTTTDAKGEFKLKDVTNDATVTVSFVGFTAQTFKVGDKPTLDVTLSKANVQLDDVIVVGYGVQKKAHLTGAVETMKAKEIEDLPVGNLGAALQGRILGLGVSGGTQRPGARANLTIRNPATFSKDGGTTDALYVIDGVIQVTPDGKNDNTQFANLDPSEVESISVLKDGAAAIYGSRAANGVIIVTTKRGKAGAPKFSYSGSYGVNDEVYRTKMMSAHEYAMYYNIMNGPNGENAQPNKDKFFSEDELEHFKTINYDRLQPEWRSAYNMRHTMNVSGGSERATYFAGASYYEQDGNLGYLDYRKWTFRAGADVNVATGLKTGIQLSGNWSDLKKTFNKVASEAEDDDYKNLLLTPRYIPDYIDGYAVRTPGGNSGTDKVSQYHFGEIQRLRNIAQTKDKTLMLNMYAEYELPWIKGLKARVNYARYFTNSNGTQVGTKYTLYNFLTNGANGHIYDTYGVKPVLPGTQYQNGNRLYYSSTDGQTNQLNFIVSYAQTFGQHSISGLFSVERGEAESRQADVWKESPVASTNGQFGSAFGAIDGKTVGQESGTLGYIGRLNYAYANKYLAEFLFRSDASTHFAPENYWGKFYSLSTGWVISNENFFHSDKINFLKLRYSTGLLGKDDTKAWLWRQRYTFQNGKGAVFGGVSNTGASTGMKMEQSPNRNAKWSSEWKNNVGIDARFLNNRLSATIEGFYNKGTDLLMELTQGVPLTVGGSIAAENWGEMDFFGYEIGLGWNDNIGKDFTYGIDARFTWYDNKWKRGNFNDVEILKPWVAKPGQSSDIGVWGYDVLGMFKDQAEIDAYVNKYGIKEVALSDDADDNVTADKLRPGMLYYRDVRGAMNADGTFEGPDGIINENDQIQLAKRAENHYGLGFTLKAGYKGLSLDVVLSGSFGGWAEIDGNAREKMSNNISNGYYSRPAIWGNIYDPVLNPTGNMPNPHWQAVSLTPRSNFWKVSAFRMGVRNVNLNYSIPKKIVSLARMNSARVAFTILNPMFLFNPYSYKAPEGAYDAYPNLRTYSLGVNMVF
ncbi:SusC/RagA family TonB-linked outer membrane protein [Longitalea luteola]|uniref:SusC/RagA family TonB-linked outer membrane protein n=1 Tax=Longitalea luteola TaxID=2812563 RepID=UPI001A95AF3B|nr:SusC/RagA family TonB-linked outer membrane protein [Longitalea luteola]